MIAARHCEHNDRQGSDCIYLGLVCGEKSRLDTPEEKIEYLENQSVPAVEEWVVVSVGSNGEEKLKDLGISQAFDVFGLETGVLCLVCRGVGVHGQILDEGKVANEMQDNVNDLTVSFLPFLDRFGKRRKHNP